ncbi:MAG: methyltransferase [Pedosphaera sp.]|nr:methyltransferase [Pedosphaera sp.]
MNSIEQLLRQSIGLHAPAIGPASIERVVNARMQSRGLKRSEDYLELLKKSPVEWNALVESVVITETWFFREPQALAALARLVLNEWLPAYPTGRVRLLSLPCASGEEPYSMAMALLDAGVPPDRFHIDAADISARALISAEQARYGRNSFRGQDLAFRDRHFQSTREGYVLKPALRKQVHFHQANVLEAGWLKETGGYDFIFCRNLLIYFDRANQQKTLQALRRLLIPSGVLFVGPAEMSLAIVSGFVSANLPLSFACRTDDLLKQPVKQRPRPDRPLPKRNHLERLTAPASISPVAARKLPAGLAFTASAAPAENPPVDLDHAQRLADEGRLSEAAAICEAHLRQFGVSAQAYYLLGLARDAVGAASQAGEFYRRALYLDPGHYQTLVQWASLSEKNGDTARARILLTRAERAKPTALES